MQLVIHDYDLITKDGRGKIYLSSNPKTSVVAH